MQFLAVAGERHTAKIDFAVAVGVGAVVPRGEQDAEVLVVPDELVDLATLVVVVAGVAAPPRVRMDPRPLAVRKLEERREIGGKAPQAEPSKLPLVGDGLPFGLLLHRLHHEFGVWPSRESAGRR